MRNEYRNSVQKGFCPFELAEKEAKERREKAITVEKIAIKWLEWKSEKKKLKEQTRKATKSRLNGSITRLENGKFKRKLTAHGLRSIASTYLNDKFTTEPHIIEVCSLDFSFLGNRYTHTLAFIQFTIQNPCCFNANHLLIIL